MAPDQSSSLHEENQRLRDQLQELHDTLDAIRNGEVDALVNGGSLYTLESAESASNRFRGHVLRQISDAVIAVDNDYHITYLNEAAEKQYGVVATEMLGKRLNALYQYRWVRPEDEALSMAALNEVGYWRGENVHERLDGSILHVESVVSVLRDGECQPIGYLAVMRDLGETMKAKHLLEEAARQKDHFLAVLAHELRNPLSPLVNGLQLLDLGDPSSLVHTRDMMKRQLDNLVRLVDDLMDMSRITRGKLELRKEVVDMADVLLTAVETSRPLIDRNAHTLRLILGDGEHWVSGDKTRLAQIISNLLNNAAKYTKDGGTITMGLERSNSHVLVHVTDNGVGLATTDMERIFDMFAQVKDAMPGTGGLGIGLNIAQRLAKLHGGILEAHSEGPGQGCTFTLRLPFVDPPRIDRDWAGETERAKDKPARILVVDDNRDGANSLVLLLGAVGHTVQVAFNGAEAIERGAVFQPDVVLMDIGMPVMDGYEACVHMRGEPWGQRARIIAVSGWGQPHDRERSEVAGFDEHLIKPIERRTIERLLRAARQHVQ